MRPVIAAALLATAVACRPQGAVPLYTDLGSLHRPIATANARTQQYFDQGLKLYYGFNQAEAVRAFEAGARLDPQCAMCWWGVALTWGPNINSGMDSAGGAAAFGALLRAQDAAAGATPVEQQLIQALAARYSAVPLAERAARDSAYAARMGELAARYSDDADINTLAAEAAMLLRPWNYWLPDGRPHPGTGELVARLERVVARDSTHPGACHFYIHAVEKVQPERAVACAERLPALMPGAGHLVHMPAHIYFRVGRYAEAVAANEHASHADSVYLEGQRPTGLYPMFYTPHNHHFRAAAAMMMGRSADAIASARETARLAPVENIRLAPPAELYVPVPLYMMARFGRWEDILREPEPASPELRFTRGMWHYARSLAFAHTERPDSARREADSLAAVAAGYPAEAPIGLNAGRLLLEIASHTLQGVLAERSGRMSEAERHFRAAIRIEDALTYDEPPPWYYPVRQSLADALLATGRARDAEAVYREDLRRYPENGWSLRGLRNALRNQGRTLAADSADARLRAAWDRADSGLLARN